uniref:Afadin n=2 Tax=Cacopsylla melanoneura TaxID=428564 RepID=A0A8D8LPY9_9HEMI
MNAEMSLVMKKTEEREALRGVIQQWNANRLDLFELSEPNDDLLFHGVMRFYFQDSGQKVATKCIRVASDATSQAVIETLIEKFRPDMRMLSVPEYALYEIHENGDERRLGTDEKPLLVQLNWHKDDREGRFLLRRIDDVTNVPAGTFQEQGSSFRRKLSKREKKQLKKQEKINRVKSIASTDENCGGVAEKLYTELPETSFTRSISNPESVMRRRRQQKLEQKLQQFRSKDGGPDTGGTLKIYGESLCRDVPYKTLLLSVRDNATQVVKEMLAKYGLTREDAHQYCLVQVNTAIPETPPTTQQNGGDQFMNNQREYILDEDECPLAILMNHPQSRGSIMFHVRRRPADYHPRKRKKKIQQKWNQGSSNELMEYRYEEGFDRLPFFLELNPDGSEITSGSPKRHRLHPNVTEVGSDRASPYGQSQSLQLFGPNIQPRHCVIAHTEGIVTVTPCSREAETFVNGQRIFETTILQHGATVKFGRIHNFKFIDPCFEERNRQRHDYSYDSRQCSTSVHEGSETPAPHNYETTFDVHGNVETRSTSSQGNRDDTRSQRSIESSRDSHNRSSTYERYSRGTDPILPAVLEIREETEEAFLHALITDLEPSAPSFKLAPAYTLYLAARYRASTHYRPELIPTERAHRLTLVLVRVAAMIHNVIQDRYCDVQSLALWLANASELLNFLKSDRHICAFSLEAQDSLADTVQITFRHLLVCLQRELAAVMPSFLSDHDDQNGEADDVSTSSVLGVLMSAMALLRGCRLNAALTIQLFSKLFHFLNVWAFNRLVAPNSIYCSKAWGLRIKNRLAHIQIWAERQGLELAADCHLAKLMQAAHLLQAPKYTGDELAELTSTCFKLNSLQLRALLHKYQPTPDEPRLPHDVIENVVRVAENLADELARSDGREVCLEEESELLLPFLLPDDGYSCEVVRGVPQGLIEFISPLQVAGLCRLSAQPTSNGYWTVYMGPHNSQGPVIRSPSAMSNRSSGYVANREEPDIQVIKLHKSNSGMGLSIVAAKGAGQDRLGIYIKSVVKGGAADANGRLQAGDQLLKVDGQSLVGITQEKAAEYLVRTGPIVTLEIAKQGAIYHGLATLLSQPSPVMTRGPRRMSERDLPSRVLTEQQNSQPNRNPHPQIQSSKSVPSLHNVNDGLSASSPMSTRIHHEVFNPGYSRTSSTSSIPQTQQSIRSRSSQNLLENLNPSIPGHHPNHPPPGVNPHPVVSRQASTPSLPQSSPYPNDPERFYQNLSVYRNQEIHRAQQDIQRPPMGGELHNGYPDSAKSPTPTQPQHPLHKGYSSQVLNRPPPGPERGDRTERPTSAYLPDYPRTPPSRLEMSKAHSARDMLRQEAKLSEMSEEVRRRDLRGDTGPLFNKTGPHGGLANSQQHIANSNPHIPNSHSSPHIANAQHIPNSNQHIIPNSNQHIPNSQHIPSSHHNGGPHLGTPPGPGGKHMPPHHANVQYVKSTAGAGLDRESPPPPPPPTSTHPLYTRDSNRYQASSAEPPRGGYLSSSQGNNQAPRQYQFQGTNPWEREEREKEQLRRREAAKIWRDQQITELGALGTNRTQSQEEQLRALRLEKEFERRAEEEEDEEEEDQETGERVQGLLRVAQQMDLEHQHQQQQQNQHHPSHHQQNNHHGPPPNSQWNNSAYLNGGTSITHEEKERLRRLKEIKQSEVEAAREKENEQMMKKKEELSNLNQRYLGSNGPSRPSHLRLDNSSHHDTSSQLANGSPAQQRLDSLVGGSNLPPEPPERVSSFAVMSSTLRSPVMSNEYHMSSSMSSSHLNSTHNTMNSTHNPLNSTHNTMNSSHMNSSLHSTINSSHNPLNSSHMNNTSHNNMNSSHNTSSHDSNNNPNSGTPTNSTPSKRVSFQDTSSVSRQSASPPSPMMEKIREDPNSFINEAENMLASPKTPDGHFAGTPSVIGTQEIYKDPRQRRLAQQQQEKMLNNKTSQVPEKLSFKEKMKMFAMETGEDGTPRDKVKISRAQRDIDNLGTPGTPTSTNSNDTNSSNVSVNNLNSKFKSAAITSN